DPLLPIKAAVRPRAKSSVTASTARTAPQARVTESSANAGSESGEAGIVDVPPLAADHGVIMQLPPLDGQAMAVALKVMQLQVIVLDQTLHQPRKTAGIRAVQEALLDVERHPAVVGDEVVGGGESRHRNIAETQRGDHGHGVEPPVDKLGRELRIVRRQ